MLDEYRLVNPSEWRPDLSPRSYTLGKRAESARSTREEILRAAQELAARVGFAGLTVEAVAAEAEVSRLTVYNHFESKSGLLEALAWSIFASADISRVREARMDPDVDAALHRFIVENARFLSAIGPNGRSVLGAALGDPDLRVVIDATYVAGRRSAITELVERLGDAGRLPRDWSPERAVASLMVLTSLESFETLTVHSGWDAEDAGPLLADMASALFDA